MTQYSFPAYIKHEIAGLIIDGIPQTAAELFLIARACCGHAYQPRPGECPPLTLVIPSFGMGDISTMPTRALLRHWGINAVGIGPHARTLGLNDSDIAIMEARIAELLTQHPGQKISLLGAGEGGQMAVLLAAGQYADHIEQIITVDSQLSALYHQAGISKTLGGALDALRNGGKTIARDDLYRRLLRPVPMRCLSIGHLHSPDSPLSSNVYRNYAALKTNQGMQTKSLNIDLTRQTVGPLVTLMDLRVLGFVSWALKNPNTECPVKSQKGTFIGIPNGSVVVPATVVDNHSNARLQWPNRRRFSSCNAA